METNKNKNAAIKTRRTARESFMSKDCSRLGLNLRIDTHMPLIALLALKGRISTFHFNYLQINMYAENKLDHFFDLNTS